MKRSAKMELKVDRQQVIFFLLTEGQKKRSLAPRYRAFACTVAHSRWTLKIRTQFYSAYKKLRAGHVVLML